MNTLTRKFKQNQFQKKKKKSIPGHIIVKLQRERKDLKKNQQQRQTYNEIKITTDVSTEKANILKIIKRK